jgi:protein-L-isoaspartate(D-aspartate) O-methyltransferase
MKATERPEAAAGDKRPTFPVRLPANVSGPSVNKRSFGSTASNVSDVSKLLQPLQPLAPKHAVRSLQKPVPAGVGLDSQAVRSRMVDKLAKQGVQDAAVLAAMGQVERHRFVDTALANQAYEDTSLPIGLGQTISKPNVVARMLELLRQGKGPAERLGRVLEIGTGCGYQAAVLSHLAGEVYSIERLRGLHEKARENLRHCRLANVHLLFGDGMDGFAKGAPYAAIIAAAGGEAIPAAWIEQLAVGGRLVAPMQTANGQQALVVIDKTAQGIRQAVLEPVHFVPLKSGTN